MAVNAFLRAVSGEPPIAVSAPMLGTQMLALLPLAEEYALPMVTVSGTAKVTELGNPWVFRFFPGDEVVKRAQARYAVEEMGAKRPAIVYQTTAYGQSGREHLAAALEDLGAPAVFEEAVGPAVKDMLPVIGRALAADPDLLLLHLHSGPTALFIRQARGSGSALPILAGSAMHQPATADLLTPAELRGVCAESGSSPVSGGDQRMDAFLAAYRAAYGTEPDAFALGQYDAVAMVLDAVRRGAATPDAVREHLATASYDGIAMTYRPDGKGNMAHDAVILCYDGEGRTPLVVKRYAGSPG